MNHHIAKTAKEVLSDFLTEIAPILSEIISSDLDKSRKKTDFRHLAEDWHPCLSEVIEQILNI